MQKTAENRAIRMRDDALIDARGIGVCYGERWVIRGVDISVRGGEIVTLIGPNGSGKSTTAKAILGLIPLTAGAVAKADGLRIGYVPQRLAIDPTLPLAVSRLMTLTDPHGTDEIERALDAVGISHLSQASVQALSGGEFQRALMARAIIREPDLLVLDEPVQGVDFSGQIALYELIRSIRDRLQCGILLISHDLHIVMAETDRVICLNGHVCCSGTPKVVSKSPEYLQLFGPQAAEALAIYHHDHDHAHGPDGGVIPLGSSSPSAPADATRARGDTDAAH